MRCKKRVGARLVRRLILNLNILQLRNSDGGSAGAARIDGARAARGAFRHRRAAARRCSHGGPRLHTEKAILTAFHPRTRVKVSEGSFWRGYLMLRGVVA